MFRIGEFSKLCGLSIDTLYHYETKKILVPTNVDEFTGYRYYEPFQLVTVNKILALKDASFSLDEIAKILNSNLSTLSLVKMLEKKATHLEDLLYNETNRLERLHTNIFLIKNGGIPQMNDITIKKVESILITSVRRTFHKSKFDDELENMWREVNQYIDSNGGKRTIPCMMLYHTGWWDMDDTSSIDVEVVEPVIKAFDGDGNVLVYELPAVKKMACVVHKGPFTTIAKTFEAFFEWINQNGYVTDGPLREIYHKGEWATENPDEYITELQIPIK